MDIALPTLPNTDTSVYTISMNNALNTSPNAMNQNGLAAYVCSRYRSPSVTNKDCGSANVRNVK